MRVLLVQPNYGFVYGFREKASSLTPPLGLCYIAAVLEKDGHNVRIIDMEAEEINKQTLTQEILRFKVDVVGITCVTSTYPIALEIARLAKKVNCDTTTVMGGSHVTATPFEVASHDEVDFCVVGEGENTMQELISAIENNKSPSKVKGLIFKNNGRITATGVRSSISNLDTLPFPARHLLRGKYKPSIHRDFGNPTAVMMTSRGCPFNCTFCASNIVFGRKCRFRSVNNILAEIDFLVEEHNVKNLLFWDDTFSLDKKRIEIFCHKLKKRNYSLVWTCNSRPDTIDARLLNTMRKAGCAMIFYGVESGVQMILDYLKRNISLEQIKTAFKLARRENIWTVATSIFGTPWDTRDSIMQSVKFVFNLKPDFLSVSILSPHPGTDIYRYALKEGIIKEVDWSASNQFKGLPWGHPTVCLALTRKELQELHRWAYRVFYLNPRYYLRKLPRLRSRDDLHVILRSLRTWTKEVGR